MAYKHEHFLKDICKIEEKARKTMPYMKKDSGPFEDNSLEVSCFGLEEFLDYRKVLCIRNKFTCVYNQTIIKLKVKKVNSYSTQTSVLHKTRTSIP